MHAYTKLALSRVSRLFPEANKPKFGSWFSAMLALFAVSSSNLWFIFLGIKSLRYVALYPFAQSSFNTFAAPTTFDIKLWPLKIGNFYCLLSGHFVLQMIRIETVSNSSEKVLHCNAFVCLQRKEVNSTLPSSPHLYSTVIPCPSGSAFDHLNGFPFGQLTSLDFIRAEKCILISKCAFKAGMINVGHEIE